MKSRPYTCRECPAYLDSQEEIRKWREIATELYEAHTKQGSIVDAILLYNEGMLNE